MKAQTKWAGIYAAANTPRFDLVGSLAFFLANIKVVELDTLKFNFTQWAKKHS